jgi:hypothetical protein
METTFVKLAVEQESCLEAWQLLKKFGPVGNCVLTSSGVYWTMDAELPGDRTEELTEAVAEVEGLREVIVSPHEISEGLDTIKF